MTRRIADLLAWHRAGYLSHRQLIDGLRRIGVTDPEGLANDPNVPDPSSAGFEQRVRPYVHIEPSPTLGWLR